MMLMPPPKGVCPICAHDHTAEQPHNCQSMYYQYRFYGVRGRWPTWADAVAHCADDVREHWTRELQRMGHWSEPADSQPIADPPAESITQAIGDVSVPGFGPEAEQFAACDQPEGETMLVFSDRATANRYIVHRQSLGQSGMIAMAEDTRGGSGLCVMFRDPVPPARLQERIGNCLWLLEETLAGRSPWPQAGEVRSLGKVGGTAR